MFCWVEKLLGDTQSIACPVNFMSSGTLVWSAEVLLIIKWWLHVVSKSKSRFLKNRGRSKLWYFPCGDDFFYDFNAFYEQCLHCVFSVHAIHTAHDYFIIVTHTLHLRAKNILSCALVTRDCYYLLPLSQVWFLFTTELSTYGIVALCSDQKFINVSHEKIDIKLEIVIFFQKSN